MSFAIKQEGTGDYKALLQFRKKWDVGRFSLSGTVPSSKRKVSKPKKCGMAHHPGYVTPDEYNLLQGTACRYEAESTEAASRACSNANRNPGFILHAGADACKIGLEVVQNCNSGATNV